MGLFDFLSDENEIEQGSTLSAGQQKLNDKVSEFLRKNVGRGATKLPFDAAAEQNELFGQAFQQFSESFNDPKTSARITQGLEDIFSGKGVFQSDIGRVSREFNQNITTPVTNILKETLGVSTQDALNQPGRLFASDTRENVGRAITQELGRSTAPLLAQSIEGERNRGFASNEAFLARQPGAINAIQSQPITEFQQAFGAAGLDQQNRQNDVNIRAQEFLRTSAENDPFLQLALGFSTAQTQENIAFQGTDRIGQLLGLGGALGGAAIYGSLANNNNNTNVGVGNNLLTG